MENYSFAQIVQKDIDVGFMTIPLWSILLIIVILIIILCKKGFINDLLDNTGLSNMIGGQNDNSDNSDNPNNQNNSNNPNNNQIIKIYNFNTDWCGHSKQFQPVWDKFQEDTNLLPNIEALDIKCDNEDGEPICREYNITAFPTVLLEKLNDNQDPIRIPFEGERTLESLQNFRDDNL